MFAAEPLNPAAPGDRLMAGFADRLQNRLPHEAIVSGRMGWPLGNGRTPGMAGSADFLGVNYYTRYRFRLDWRRPAHSFEALTTPGAEVSDLGYGEIYPPGMYHVLMLAGSYARRLGKPIIVTENGLPDADDDARPRFLLTHLAQVWRAIQAGAPVQGYFHWSLIDNFEWADGYDMRFGLIEVDFATQARRMRRSGELYAEICRANAITSEMARRYAPAALSDLQAAWRSAKPIISPALAPATRCRTRSLHVRYNAVARLVRGRASR
jgi:beta-glucosidase